jgi:hypothetical protein
MAQTTAVVPTGPIEDVHKGHASSSSKLEDQAAAAALYVTKPEGSKNGHSFLDGDNKLSSAGTFRLAQNDGVYSLNAADKIPRRCRFPQVRQSTRSPKLSFNRLEEEYLRRGNCRDHRLG